MLREAVKKHYLGMNQEFRFRGEEPGRLENLSDALFALAITLLLISTSPPQNFDELKRFAWDLIPFTICIALIVLIWHEHFTFFFRYGLRDPKTIIINTLFLIILVFYVYPLKFLATLILIPISYLVGDDTMFNELIGMIHRKDFGDLMIFYGLGAAIIFFLLMLMYRHALKLADKLGLNEIEKFDTKQKVTSCLLMGIIPVISIIVSAFLRGSNLAGFAGGMVYFLYTPIMMIHGARIDKGRKIILDSMSASN